MKRILTRIGCGKPQHDYIDRSVKWLESIIPAGSRILDLGCGPGLYTKGCQMRAMTLPVSIIQGVQLLMQRSTTQKRYICRNYLEMDYREFDAITLIYCDYATLIPDEEKRCCPKYIAHLNPAVVHFCVFTEKTHKDRCDRTSWSYHENGGFGTTSRICALKQSIITGTIPSKSTRPLLLQRTAYANTLSGTLRSQNRHCLVRWHLSGSGCTVSMTMSAAARIPGKQIQYALYWKGNKVYRINLLNYSFTGLP